MDHQRISEAPVRPSGTSSRRLDSFAQPSWRLFDSGPGQRSIAPLISFHPKGPSHDTVFLSKGNEVRSLALFLLSLLAPMHLEPAMHPVQLCATKPMSTFHQVISLCQLHVLWIPGEPGRNWLLLELAERERDGEKLRMKDS